MSFLQNLVTFLFSLLSFIKDVLDTKQWENTLILTLLPVVLTFSLLIYDSIMFVTTFTSVATVKLLFYRTIYRDDEGFGRYVVNRGLLGEPISCNISHIAPTKHMGGECLVLSKENLGKPEFEGFDIKDSYSIGNCSFIFRNGSLEGYNHLNELVVEHSLTDCDFIIHKMKSILCFWENNLRKGVMPFESRIIKYERKGEVVLHSMTIQEIIYKLKEGYLPFLIDLPCRPYTVEGLEEINSIVDKILTEKLGLVNKGIFKEIINRYFWSDSCREIVAIKFINLCSSINILNSLKDFHVMQKDKNEKFFEFYSRKREERKEKEKEKEEEKKAER